MFLLSLKDAVHDVLQEIPDLEAQELTIREYQSLQRWAKWPQLGVVWYILAKVLWHDEAMQWLYSSTGRGRLHNIIISARW